MLTAPHRCGSCHLEAEMLTWDESNTACARYLSFYEGILRARDTSRFFASISDRLEIGTVSNTPLLHSAWFIAETSLNSHSAPTRPPLRSRAANVARTKLNGFFSASKANLRNAP